MSLTPSATDTELFHALRDGEAAALDELFRRHYAELCRTALRFVSDAPAAEDVVQDFFVSLWSKRKRLPSDTQSVPAYLRRSVRNRSLNYLRDRNRIPVDDGEPPYGTPDSGRQPQEALESAETRERIEAAIDRLPERCRLVFVMSKLEDMSHREIADGLDISVKTVENQMTRAYKYLREWLALFLLLYIHSICLN